MKLRSLLEFVTASITSSHLCGSVAEGDEAGRVGREQNVAKHAQQTALARVKPLQNLLQLVFVMAGGVEVEEDGAGAVLLVPRRQLFSARSDESEWLLIR